LNLGEKITFALGEIIDNIVDGWVRVTGGLNVTGDVVVGGDINVTGDVVVGNQKITGLCPTGWIMVPGNASLGTIVFLCYEIVRRRLGMELRRVSFGGKSLG